MWLDILIYVFAFYGLAYSIAWLNLARTVGGLSKSTHPRFIRFSAYVFAFVLGPIILLYYKEEKSDGI